MKFDAYAALAELRMKDGGPAFPGTTSQPNKRGVYYPVHHPGMTLRDWFAAHVVGFSEGAGDDTVDRFNRDPKPPRDDRLAWAIWFAKADARYRYLLADAMLAARAQTEGEGET